MKFVDGKNYFNEASFNEICEALDKGKTVQVGIDCIGHTRNNNEQEAYREALENKYQSNLWVECQKGNVSYSYTYRLKYFACGGKNEETLA